jgi:hypothetical protein
MFAGKNAVWLVIIVVTLAAVSVVYGAPIYQAPDEEVYYATLKQPDSPAMNCCGWGDAYYADKVAECPPEEANCALVAIITDTRPDTREYVRDDGSKITITRPHAEVGTRIIVPRHKVRKHPVENPTEHNIIFVAFTEWGSGVYCWEPVGGI